MITTQLKEGTFEYHEQLEQKLKSSLFKEELSPLEYLNLIKKFNIAYQTLEKAIGYIPYTNSLLKTRTKLPMLQNDIQYLEDLVGEKLLYDKETISIEPINNLAKALGIMYVMEGATLGGNVILKILKQHSWVETEKGLNFFNSYGEERGKMWKDFIQIIDTHINLNPHDSEELIEGAKMAFIFIDKILSNKN